jgi:hypothetical protein
MTDQDAVAIDAHTLTTILGSYLQAIDPDAFKSPDDRLEADLAVEILLEEELNKIHTKTSDDAYVHDITTSAIFGYGVKFGVEAATAALQSAPHVALQDVADIFSELKARLQRQIDEMQRSQADEKGGA